MGCSSSIASSKSFHGAQKIKLIFLDVDGVLVTRRRHVFDISLLANLARVVKETEAQIVLSSDWRRHLVFLEEVKQWLRSVGLDYIDHTPCMDPAVMQRPVEILTWTENFKKRLEFVQITHWVAIDDRPLLSERQGNHLRGHFVKTKRWEGLTDAKAAECISILNNKVAHEDYCDVADVSRHALSQTVAYPMDSCTRPVFTGKHCHVEQRRLVSAAKDTNRITRAESCERALNSVTARRKGGSEPFGCQQVGLDTSFLLGDSVG